MTSATVHPRLRAKPGHVRTKIARNSIQLVFTYRGKRHYIAPGLAADSPWDQKRATDIAFQIQKDLEYGEFDPTYQKYRIKPDPAENEEQDTDVPQPALDLPEIWDKYKAVKIPGKSPSTIREYGWVGNHLARCPHKQLDEAQQILDWAGSHIPPKSRRKLFRYLAACCKWAQRSHLIKTNPFEGSASEVKVKKSSTEEDEIYPFSRREREQVITAFRCSRRYKNYAPLIEFLFLTGCRPSEAIALQWKHIRESDILFEQAFVYAGRDGIVLKPSLKTQLRRKFPINPQLSALLSQLRARDCSGETFVFPSPRGKTINWGNFTNRAWQKVMASLLEIEYRNPYQTRHTFCSLCREAGIPSVQIAKWVGNSAAMIDRVYTKAVENVQVPEF